MRLNYQQLKKDLQNLLTSSQDWWPADFGNYGPFFIRLSWHSAGTYRVYDGRGGANRGQIRFSPLGSWPDNVNLDKAKQLLWPLKQRYGDSISWSDLIVLIGTVALESMGLPTIGFAFGREDDWQGDNTNWGINPEELSSNKKNENLQTPFSATQMGLIYVNPEGPLGKPDRLGAAKDIRQAFSGMGMSDRQTVALIAGGHTLGKCHGAAPSNKYVGPAPNRASIEFQGLGWENSFGTGKGADTIGSGLQGSWTSTPTKWGHDFLNNLYNLNWTLTKSPGEAHQWIPTNNTGFKMVPDAHKPNVFHKPFMLTTDLALRQDSEFKKYTKQFYQNPIQFQKSFAEAWFKLTHRDMGPKTRYFGPWVPKKDFIWQDPVPQSSSKTVSDFDIDQLKLMIAKSGLNISQLVRTAWASASTYRKTDYRGGSQGCRIALAPMKSWQINQPQKLYKVISKLQEIQKKFNGQRKDGTQISLADLIVLGGNVGIEQAALQAGSFIKIKFVPGRGDAIQQQTDVESFQYLKSKSDGFINYHDGSVNPDLLPQALVQKANMLTLDVSEMTVLLGGLRALGVNYKNSSNGVFTTTPGKLDNSFFIKLLDYSTEWRLTDKALFTGYDRKNGNKKYTATPFDLMFGSHPELRAVAQFYAQSSNGPKFLKDFVGAWSKVMMLGRFDYR